MSGYIYYRGNDRSVYNASLIFTRWKIIPEQCAIKDYFNDNGIFFEFLKLEGAWTVHSYEN